MYVLQATKKVMESQQLWIRGGILLFSQYVGRLEVRLEAAMFQAVKIWEMWCITCMTFPTALPLPIVQFTPSTFAMARQPYSLICTVQVVQYLAAIVNVTWLSPDGNSLQNGSGITVGKAVRNGNITTLRFTVDELAQSHAGNYTCQACISIDKAAIEGDCGYAMAEVTLSGKIICNGKLFRVPDIHI